MKVCTCLAILDDVNNQIVVSKFIIVRLTRH